MSGAAACPHTDVDRTRCDVCGFTYCDRCSDHLGCPRCRADALSRTGRRHRRRLIGALCAFVAGTVAGAIVLLSYIEAHPAGLVFALLIGYGVLCCYWVAANAGRIATALDITGRDVGRASGCVSLFAPVLLLAVVPALVMTPFDMANLRREEHDALAGARDIEARLASA